MQLFSAVHRNRVNSLLFTTCLTATAFQPAVRVAVRGAVPPRVPVQVAAASTLTLSAQSQSQEARFNRRRRSRNLDIGIGIGIKLRGGSLCSSSSALSLSSSSEGQTGWNHNLPKETSAFWAATDIDSDSTSLSDSIASAPAPAEEARTGWLHKTSSAKKEQASSKSSSNSKSRGSKKKNMAQQLLQMAKLNQKINHRIVSPPTFHPVSEGRRVVITEHFIAVPFKYGDNGSDSDNNNGSSINVKNIDLTEQTIDVYFTIVDLISTPEDEAFYLSLQQTSPPPTTSSTTSSAPLSPTKRKHIRIRQQQQRAAAYKQHIALKDMNQAILYLQGGPGFGSPQPINGIGLSDKSSWLGSALSKGYKRVVLMDQRGTGRSTTITKQTLEKTFPDLFCLDHLSPNIIHDSVYHDSNNSNNNDNNNNISSITTVKQELEQLELKLNNHKSDDHDNHSDSDLVQKFRLALHQATDYMTHFRADSIVKDAEYIKDVLLLSLDNDENDNENDNNDNDNDNDGSTDKNVPRPWGAALGQSFGGFCMMSYLSLIPNPPKICLFTGGMAPMLTNVDDVYCSLRERVKQRNMKYYDTYPGDIALVKRIIQQLVDNPTKLPSGGILTARRFLQVGIGLGGSPSAFASLHCLFASAFVSDDDDGDDDDNDFTRAFLKSIDMMQPFDDHPIYFLMHESIYADSNSHCVKSDWSAMKAYYDNNETDFDCLLHNPLEEPTLLVGEVVFPWMADGDYAELSGLSMRALAHSIANKDDWGPLYDPIKMRKALAKDGTGVSKAAAAVYYDDMYVDFNASMKLTERGNPLENCAVWVTNDYQHSGLRDDGATIFCKLLGMAKGEIGTPS